MSVSPIKKDCVVLPGGGTPYGTPMRASWGLVRVVLDGHCCLLFLLAIGSLGCRMPSTDACANLVEDEVAGGLLVGSISLRLSHSLPAPILCSFFN